MALADEEYVNILVFQEITPDAYNCAVQTMLYTPGWQLQTMATRPEVKEMLTNTGQPLVLIHLNAQVTHFSAVLRGDAALDYEAQRGKKERKSRKRKTDAVVEVED